MHNLQRSMPCEREIGVSMIGTTFSNLGHYNVCCIGYLDSTVLVDAFRVSQGPVTVTDSGLSLPCDSRRQ
jgi:hypothetical protein